MLTLRGGQHFKYKIYLHTLYYKPGSGHAQDFVARRLAAP